MEEEKKSKKQKTISYRDIIRPTIDHPYQTWFAPEIIHRARCIEDQRRLAELFNDMLSVQAKPVKK
jgi:hypothetical protein